MIWYRVFWRYNTGLNKVFMKDRINEDGIRASDMNEALLKHIERVRNLGMDPSNYEFAIQNKANLELKVYTPTTGFISV